MYVVLKALIKPCYHIYKPKMISKTFRDIGLCKNTNFTVNARLKKLPKYS